MQLLQFSLLPPLPNPPHNKKNRDRKGEQENEARRGDVEDDDDGGDLVEVRGAGRRNGEGGWCR